MKRVCPVHLFDESVSIFVAPYDWVNTMVVLAGVFFCCGKYGFITVEVGVILQNGCGIQGQNFLEFLQDSEMAAGCHCKN